MAREASFFTVGGNTTAEGVSDGESAGGTATPSVARSAAAVAAMLALVGSPPSAAPPSRWPP